MADEKPTPTEEQIKDANAAEEAYWQGDFKPEDLKIPYKREDSDDSKDNTGNNGDGSNGTTKQTDDNGGDESPQDEQYLEPAPLITTEDPGDYQPADYSFEVTNKDGKTVKINSPEEAEKYAEDDDNFKTATDLKNFMLKSASMERKLERDREKYDEQKAQYDEQVKQEAERTQAVTDMAAEFQYLVSKGMLPKVDAQYAEANWSDPTVAKQPGVKEQLALLDYMQGENEVRRRAGVKPISSVLDAYNGWKREQDAQEAEEAHKQAGEARRQAGARVAASSPAQQGFYAPKGIAVGNPNVFKRNQSVWDN